MSVKVKVREGWAVYDGTSQRGAGEVLDVDPDTAEQWLAAGWVDKAKPKATARKATAPRHR